jgi:hypothetical protein
LIFLSFLVFFWIAVLGDWLTDTPQAPTSCFQPLLGFWFCFWVLGCCTFIISESLEQIHSSVQAAASKQIRQAKLVIYSNAASWIHARETQGVYRKASDNSQYWWRRSARPYSCHHSYWTRRQTTGTHTPENNLEDTLFCISCCYLVAHELLLLAAPLMMRAQYS